ncbi:exosortase A [Sphingomonas mucosissima]|uniref:Transmembrane exosortase EpsH n=1 Tax=Sphingomonas mucosissima TaxID=370959 RepID=A0A245ZR29_9SPHN|nr:exosortase A [Sphingomonas mucosissima]OWK32194.1 transmembrane exosortase EpsH [Sphingomonas mucosissima]
MSTALLLRTGGLSVARWRVHLAALASASLAILLLFRHDVADLTHLWWTSTTYGHCLFILPVVAWLIWIRRHELAGLTPAAWWPGLVVVAAGCFGWLLGEAAGVAGARHFGVVIAMQGAVVTILGPHVARALLFPLCYAFFAVPFGEWLEPPLQQITVSIVMPLLHLAGVPAAVEGVLIHAGPYYFEVAEACSGSKFVLSMVAFAALVANTCFRSWRRRAAFMAVALIVPILANGVRAFGTILAAQFVGLEAATGFDHIVYGWLFFAVVMGAVMAGGWRWFDRAPDEPAFDPAALAPPRRHRIGALSAALLVASGAALFVLWASAIGGRSQPLPAQLQLPQVLGWSRAPLSNRAPWEPFYPGADHRLIGRYVDGRGHAVDLAIAVFARQGEGKEVISYGTGVLRENGGWVRVASLPALDGGSAMRITAPGPVQRVVVTWYRVAGEVTSSPLVVKLATLKARLIGGEPAAVAVHLSAEDGNGQDATAAVSRFRSALGSIDRATAEVMH